MQDIFNSERWHYNDPDAYWTIQYEYKRSGADMQYRFRWKAWVRWSTSWYDYGLQLRLFLDGVQHNVTVKGVTTNNPGWSYEGTTDWYTVANKTTGTTQFYASMHDTSRNATQATSSTYTLTVSPCAATITSYPEVFYSNGNPPTIQYSNPAGNNVTSLDVCIADDRAWNAYVGYRPLIKTGNTYQFTADDMKVLKELSGKSLNLTFVIRTIIGGESLATYEPSTFEMVENEDTKPSVRMEVKPDNSSLPSEFSNLWIQGKSKADITVTTEGKYNAKITSISKEVDDKAYTGGVIEKSGKINITATATDTRGFTGKDTKEIDVIEYSKPLVIPIGTANAIQCYRSDENGNRVGNSEYLCIKARRSYRDVGGSNKCALQWRRKLSTDTWDDNVHEWYDLISKDTTDMDEYRALLPRTGDSEDTFFEKDKSYTVQIRAKDDIGEYDIKTFDIPTEDVALHLGKGGKNVSVGTYCDITKPYTFYSSWEAIFDNGISGTILNKLAGDVLEFAEECAVGFTPFYTGELSTSLPLTGNYQYSTGVVQRRSPTQINVYITNYLTGAIAINIYLDGEWRGWKYITPQ